MKVFLYRVELSDRSIPFENAIREIHATALQRRNILLNGETIRMEHYALHRDLTFCDFVKLRFNHGPGRAGMNNPITGFDLAADEGFGEETAMVYDPLTQYAAIQYNHYGPRPKAIEDYLNTLPNLGLYCRFLPRYDEDLQRRLGEVRIYRKLDIALATRFLNAQDHAEGLPLQRAIELSQEVGADMVEVTLSVTRGRARQLIHRNIRNILDWVSRRQAILGEEDRLVDKCILTARRNEEDASEVLDLLAQRLMLDPEVIAGGDRRYPRQNRYNAVEHSFRHWHRALDLGG